MRTNGRPGAGYRAVGGANPDRRDPEERWLIERSSMSGHERNHFFLAEHGERFTDLSALSGLDHPGDSRAFALIDFDRDGWLDIAVVNANAPFLQLFRNRIGDQQDGRLQALALRFVGANHTATSDAGRTHRDGYGASVTVNLGELQLLREHRAGAGLAAQNSSTLLVGIGDHGEAHSLNVRWPSGRVHKTTRVPAGTLITVYEEPAHSPTGEAFTFEGYAAPRRWHGSSEKPVQQLKLATRFTGEAEMMVFTTMATWCPACQRELPQLRRLRSELDSLEVEMFGVPVDGNDSREMLESYLTEHNPAYRLLLDLPTEEVSDLETAIFEALHDQPLPSTVITDRLGRILRVEAGVPTVSDLRSLLEGSRIASARRGDVSDATPSPVVADPSR